MKLALVNTQGINVLNLAISGTLAVQPQHFVDGSEIRREKPPGMQQKPS